MPPTGARGDEYKMNEAPSDDPLDRPVVCSISVFFESGSESQPRLEPGFGFEFHRETLIRPLVDS